MIEALVMSAVFSLKLAEAGKTLTHSAG